eukprot:496043-Amphidinium_carterae.1
MQISTPPCAKTHGARLVKKRKTELCSKKVRTCGKTAKSAENKKDTITPSISKASEKNIKTQRTNSKCILAFPDEL